MHLTSLCSYTSVSSIILKLDLIQAPGEIIIWLKFLYLKALEKNNWVL